MSDTIESSTAGKTTGVGSVCITVDDHKNKSYDPQIVIPDANKQVTITLVSEGPNKTWTFKPTPISIRHGHGNFTYTVDSTNTVLTLTDSEADKGTHPQHSYTCHVESNTGDSLDIDPIIKDQV